MSTQILGNVITRNVMNEEELINLSMNGIDQYIHNLKKFIQSDNQNPLKLSDNGQAFDMHQKTVDLIKQKIEKILNGDERYYGAWFDNERDYYLFGQADLWMKETQRDVYIQEDFEKWYGTKYKGEWIGEKFIKQVIPSRREKLKKQFSTLNLLSNLLSENKKQVRREIEKYKRIKADNVGVMLSEQEKVKEDFKKNAERLTDIQRKMNEEEIEKAVEELFSHEDEIFGRRLIGKQGFQDLINKVKKEGIGILDGGKKKRRRRRTKKKRRKRNLKKRTRRRRRKSKRRRRR